jgi:hypothetical protein
MDPDDAFLAIDAGADWMFHQCIGGLIRSSAGHADDVIAYARHACITETERRRLLTRSRRGKTVPTVVLAERWADGDGRVLVVFREAGPQLIAPRRRPDRLGTAPS